GSGQAPPRHGGRPRGDDADTLAPLSRHSTPRLCLSGTAPAGLPAEALVGVNTSPPAPQGFGGQPTHASRAQAGWGARIRTWDRGTKIRCLTTWPRPKAGETVSAIHPAGNDGRGNARALEERSLTN